MRYSLVRERLVLNWLPVSISPSLRSPLFSLRLAYFSSSISNFTRTRRQLPHRAIASVSDSSGLFNYSSGRWLVNDDLRLAERRREFDVDGLRRLATQSVNRNSQYIDTFMKLAEGGFKMVSRIPHPVTVPKFYAIASEAATMHFLRSSGLPDPKVYDYSPSSDNAARTQYIFMEFMRGMKLSDVWLEPEEPDIASALRQLAQLESRMMSIPFPAGGSLYYTTGNRFIMMNLTKRSHFGGGWRSTRISIAGSGCHLQVRVPSVTNIRRDPEGGAVSTRDHDTWSLIFHRFTGIPQDSGFPLEYQGFQSCLAAATSKVKTYNQ